jgi:hypothetical protein
MALNYVHRTAIQNARNGTASHTISFAAATAQNLLVAVAEGGVTLTTPTGWTPVNSSVYNMGFYIWKKTASAGESSAATTANSSNYPIAGVVYEFASGSTLDSSVTSGSTAGQAYNAANPSITPSSSQTAIALASYNVGNDLPGWSSVTWSAGTEDFDLYTAYATTDGYLVSASWIPGTGAAFAPTTTPNAGTTADERQSMSMALTIVAPSTFLAPQPYTIQQAVNRSYTY